MISVHLGTCIGILDDGTCCTVVVLKDFGGAERYLRVGAVRTATCAYGIGVECCIPRGWNGAALWKPYGIGVILTFHWCAYGIGVERCIPRVNGFWHSWMERRTAMEALWYRCKHYIPLVDPAVHGETAHRCGSGHGTGVNNAFHGWMDSGIHRGNGTGTTSVVIKIHGQQGFPCTRGIP